MKKKIFVAMSGGVDSSVSALILLQQGYSVEAIFMKNWNDKYCSINEDIKDVKYICKKLKIKLHIIEFSNEYWNSVFSNSINLFNEGYTPNPDVLCNKEIKFKVLIEYIFLNGVFKIATGHYIKKQKINGVYFMLNANDERKDQSYFLCLINRKALRNSVFPIGHMEKSIVRKIAFYYKFEALSKILI